MPQRNWGNWGQVAYNHMQSEPIACEVLQEGEGNVWPGPFSLPRLTWRCSRRSTAYAPDVAPACRRG